MYVPFTKYNDELWNNLAISCRDSTGSNKGSFDLTKQAVLHDEKHTPYVNIKV